jgi:hypothetical protein
VDRLSASCESWTHLRYRTYRADVVISIMGVPIFSRQGVGSAWMRLREGARDGLKTVSILFAGGSDPGRAHGVNYCGSAEEVAVEDDGGLSEAASFGFVTASPSDESFDQARHRVMDGNRKDQPSFIVVDELHRASRVRVRKALAPAPDSPCPGWSQLARHIRSQFSSSNVMEREIVVPAVESTFLYSVLAAMRSDERSVRHPYFHNGRRYQLDCEKGIRGETMRLSGRIRDLENRRDSNFRLWLEAGQDLPLRVEFSPRSYLRITLEADPEIRGPLESKEDM